MEAEGGGSAGEGERRRGESRNESRLEMKASEVH
jgi:hypothetical protein